MSSLGLIRFVHQVNQSTMPEDITETESNISETLEQSIIQPRVIAKLSLFKMPKITYQHFLDSELKDLKSVDISNRHQRSKTSD